jgi:hypothetical protein
MLGLQIGGIGDDGALETEFERAEIRTICEVKNAGCVI